LQAALDALAQPTWVIEKPSGLVNGVNKDYVGTYTPVSNSLVVYATNDLNGVPLILGVHFTLAGKTATLGTARPNGSIWFHYQTLDTVVVTNNAIWMSGDNHIFMDGSNKVFN